MRKRVRSYAPPAVLKIEAHIKTLFAHTDGVDNERLLAYFSSSLTRMKKRHERGVVPRPEWCSPARWRMFAGWLRTREDAKALVKATLTQKTGEQVWQNQIKMECDKRRKERV